MLLKCGVGEDSWESLGLQGGPTSPSWRRSVLGVHWKEWYWSWNTNTLGTWCEEVTHLKRPWCWERLRAGGEGDDRGWDGWMASPTQWTWVWVGSRNWYWTGRPDVLWFVGSQRVRHDWATELNWTEQSMKGLLSSHLCQHLLLLNLFCVLHFMLSNLPFKKKKIHFIVSIQLIISSYVYSLFRLPCLSMPDLYLHTCECLTSERGRRKLGEVLINVESFCCFLPLYSKPLLRARHRAFLHAFCWSSFQGLMAQSPSSVTIPEDDELMTWQNRVPQSLWVTGVLQTYSLNTYLPSVRPCSR